MLFAASRDFPATAPAILVGSMSHTRVVLPLSAKVKVSSPTGAPSMDEVRVRPSALGMEMGWPAYEPTTLYAILFARADCGKTTAVMVPFVVTVTVLSRPVVSGVGVYDTNDAPGTRIYPSGRASCIPSRREVSSAARFLVSCASRVAIPTLARSPEKPPVMGPLDFAVTRSKEADPLSPGTVKAAGPMLYESPPASAYTVTSSVPGLATEPAGIVMESWMRYMRPFGLSKRVFFIRV